MVLAVPPAANRSASTPSGPAIARANELPKPLKKTANSDPGPREPGVNGPVASDLSIGSTLDGSYLARPDHTSESLLSSFPDVELPDWLRSCLLGRSDLSQLGTSIHDNDLVCRAFQFAYQLHEGQMRKSGDPYIAHPIAVASLLRELGGCSATIAAGFLHDVVEDTEVSHEDIGRLFGAEVRFLVEGVTKLSRIECSSKTEQQAETFRRMFLAMAKDCLLYTSDAADE